MEEAGFHKNFRILDLFLRLAVLPFAAASIWVTVMNNQATESYGEVEFSDLTGFKYLVWIDAISAGYALISVLVSCFRWLYCDWVLFIMDQVTAYLLVTSGSAVVEILYLAREGDREVSWSEVCSYFNKFCSKTKVSLVFHLLVFVCFLALSLISGFRLFSKFEAPSLSSSSNEVGNEVGRQEE